MTNCGANDGQHWAVGQEFDWPNVPRKDGAAADDWRKYPRAPENSDLATLRIDPAAEHGWFVAERRGDDGAQAVAFAYVWERAAFPWLVTWEENNARKQAPWNGRSLTRGLEFASYAMPTSRRWNVEQGKLMGQPCFEWLDANETKVTNFWISLQAQAAAEGELRLERRADGSYAGPGGSLSIPLH
eukprot:gnl/TRDRNA2_/TRDRNA2_145482_c0_seq2.p1 gnl/TRDRNA2_/TRDRNA2_145482_c0~~gnl/TRDRNA2_/TRDRNA2_145482_c0_seq2.p1  ORF type:complete len:186 (+),score=27.59 gnl/TRDRNA2_/TRDRNA2_145482_c0_seq2:449-1006(+)